MLSTKNLKRLTLAALLLAASVPIQSAEKNGGTFTTGEKTFMLNGKPFVVKAAELHYPRIPRPYWDVRHRAPRPIRMRRMGNGRTAVVAPEEKRHTAARARPLLHGACTDIRE